MYQRKVWSAEADTQAAAKELSRATEFRPVDPARTESGARSQQQKEVIEVSTEKAPTEPALTVEKVYTVPPPKAPSESLQNKILHEDNQQQLPSFHSIQQHPPGNYSQPFWYQQQYSGWHAGYLTNGRAGQSRFRFPNPDQNRRHSVKRGRSSASSGSPLGTESAAASFFRPTASEQSRHSVKDLVQFHSHSDTLSNLNV